MRSLGAWPAPITNRPGRIRHPPAASDEWQIRELAPPMGRPSSAHVPQAPCRRIGTFMDAASVLGADHSQNVGNSAGRGRYSEVKAGGHESAKDGDCRMIFSFPRLHV